MTWGHSVSTDLVSWEHLPLAIEPDGLGAIFSGSCAIDRENTAGYGENAVVAMYTSAAKSQIQSLAGSKDGGLTFEKYSGNPVLPLESEARDPNMFWNPETKEWTLILAHALDHEMLIFTSPDLKTGSSPATSTARHSGPILTETAMSRPNGWTTAKTIMPPSAGATHQTTGGS